MIDVSGGEPLVVVGVDGSAHAAVALRAGLHEAACRGGRLLAVSVWERPELTLEEFYGVPVRDAAEDRRPRLQRTREYVDEVLEAEPAVAGVPAEVEAISGHPAEVLVAAARDADLLVVGHRGRGGLASVALGSVGLGCVLHAPCPVLVVPRATAAARDEPGATSAAR